MILLARFLCKCGATLSNSESPNDVELHVFSDNECDDIINLNVFDPLNITSPKYEVWRCVKCGRVHVFAGDEVVRTYIVEM